MANGRKVNAFMKGIRTMGNNNDTNRFAAQLTNTQIDEAADLGPWVNSSEQINQGIDPGPVAKNTTNPRVATMRKIFAPSVSML